MLRRDHIIEHVQDIALDVMKVEGRHAGGSSVGLRTIRDGRSTEGDGEQNLAPFYDIFETIPQEEVATLFVGNMSKGIGPDSFIVVKLCLIVKITPKGSSQGTVRPKLHL